MGDIQQILLENALLKEQLERKNERILYLERQLFGRRSEKRLPEYSQAQLSLFDTEQGMQKLEQETSEMTSLVEEIKHKAEKRGKRQRERSISQKRSYKIPADIERRETIINPENLDSCVMIKIGEDVSERLMLDPSKFWVERVVRPVYKIQQEQQTVSTVIVQAPFNPGILPGCMAGDSLLSQIVVDKFLYHIPEYRQAVRFKELGVEITTSSINRWVHALAEKLLFSAKYFQRIINYTNSTLCKIIFAILGVPTYKSHVFTRKKNKSGSVSVQIISKERGKYRALRTIGSGRSEQDIARLTYLGKQEMERLSKQPALFVWENDIQVEQLFSNLT
jgi:transposase